MTERFVRITRTWDVPVTAEYGDTDETLLKKADAGTIPQSIESKSLLPDHVTASDVKSLADSDTPSSTEEKGKSTWG